MGRICNLLTRKKIFWLQKRPFLPKKGSKSKKSPFVGVKKQKIEYFSMKSYSLSKYLSFDMLECIDKKKNILFKKKGHFCPFFWPNKGSKSIKKSESLIFLLFHSSKWHISQMFSSIYIIFRFRTFCILFSLLKKAYFGCGPGVDRVDRVDPPPQFTDLSVTFRFLFFDAFYLFY